MPKYSDIWLTQDCWEQGHAEGLARGHDQCPHRGGSIKAELQGCVALRPLSDPSRREL